MYPLIRLPLLLLLLGITVLSSCKKNNEGAKTEPVLQPNQINEPDGIRFILTWAMKDEAKPENFARIDLELYKGVGANKSTTPIVLIPNPHTFTNYSVLEGALANGEEHTLVINYGTISKDGTFDLYIEGYTAIRSSKNFTLSNNVFTTANSQTKKDFLKIKRVGTLYTFTAL